MLVGIDDTDSPRGGCTTHFALEAAAAFRREHGLGLRSRARLVRLNPNVPWKTRGNAAVALEFGEPSGRGGALVGVAPSGEEIRSDPAAAPARPSAAHAATLDSLIDRFCDLREEGTDPAYLLAEAPLEADIYEEAVKSVVDPGRLRRRLDAMAPRPLWKALGDGRGIVGAAAAVAFPPVEPTYEIIVYRERQRWGTRRQVDFDSVERMDRAYPTTYHNIDRANRHIAIAPSTPCPLLFGIRAFSPGELQEAAASVEAGEPWGGWMVFETNQGTDAHVVPARIPSVEPLTTVSVAGTVSRRPRRVRGGHVIFAVAEDGGPELECAAYEPTKQFRDVAEALEVGDNVRALGAVRGDRRTLNLEKLEILETVARQRQSVNPACPSCGRRMKSAGASAPFRCRSCGNKRPKAEGRAAPRPRAPAQGWYEVPIAARRHLAKPIDPHGF